MNANHILSNVRAWVAEQMAGDASGHDIFHVLRVRQVAAQIAQAEGADSFVCELAALVHDVIDDKLVEDPEKALDKVVRFLEDAGVPPDPLERVKEIITTISYKGGNAKSLQMLEAKVVQDADRLDALGAIGLARTFAYSGSKGQSVYNPDIPIRTEMTEKEYRTGKSTAINHVYEKLLKLKDLMNTETAKQMAYERHYFLEQFLEQFLREWNASPARDRTS